MGKAQEFGKRLKQARKMRGMSQDALVGALENAEVDLSKNSISKYERGKMGPSSRVLLGLCAALNVRPDYFFAPRPVALGEIEFRKRSRLPEKDRNRIIEVAREFFERYLEIEQILSITYPEAPTYDLRGKAGDALLDACEEAAEDLRKRWELGTNPLPNVHEMLEDHGVKVKEAEAPETFDGFSARVGETPVMAIAKWLNKDLPRKRLTMLHELGHLVLQLPEGLSGKEKEGATYTFGGAMLIPREQFREDFGEGRKYAHVSQYELVAMKEKWGMSIAAIVKRAQVLGLLADGPKAEYFKSHRGNTFEPGNWQGSESANHFSQLVHRAAAEEVITRSKAAGLLGLSLDEFKRQSVKSDEVC